MRRVVHTARRAGDRRVDLETGEGLEAALTGCRGVYFIAPNVHPDEPGLLRRTLDAAARAGVHHVVYHSVAWPHTPAMPHHLDKAVCEDMLRTHGGVQWTILQPCAYAENFPTLLDGTATALEVPYNPDAPFTFVRLPDVAAAAARVLDEGADVHHGVTYELGPPRCRASGSGLEPSRTRSRCAASASTSGPTGTAVICARRARSPDRDVRLLRSARVRGPQHRVGGIARPAARPSRSRSRAGGPMIERAYAPRRPRPVPSSFVSRIVGPSTS